MLPGCKSWIKAASSIPMVSPMARMAQGSIGAAVHALPFFVAVYRTDGGLPIVPQHLPLPPRPVRDPHAKSAKTCRINNHSHGDGTRSAGSALLGAVHEPLHVKHWVVGDEGSEGWIAQMRLRRRTVGQRDGSSPAQTDWVFHQQVGLTCDDGRW